MSTWAEVSKDRDKWERMYKKAAADYTDLWIAIQNVCPEKSSELIHEELRLMNDRK